MPEVPKDAHFKPDAPRSKPFASRNIPHGLLGKGEKLLAGCLLIKEPKLPVFGEINTYAGDFTIIAMHSRICTPIFEKSLTLLTKAS